MLRADAFGQSGPARAGAQTLASGHNGQPLCSLHIVWGNHGGLPQVATKELLEAPSERWTGGLGSAGSEQAPLSTM